MSEDLRAGERQQFIERHLDLLGGGAGDAVRIEPASADASFRSYWRVWRGADARVLMDAPPRHEDVRPWLEVAARLQRAGVAAPEVLAHDADGGFVLMGDLGNRTLLPALDAGSVQAHYTHALELLLRMQVGTDTGGLPEYDEGRLVAELELMPQWFLQRHLGFTPECDQWDVIELAFRRLVNAALEQPRVFVHRDFHSRNLMLLADGTLATIDFQDAVRGPVTYDLVSLLRDCYVAWPRGQVEQWVESYRQQLSAAGIDCGDRARFLRWFDLMGVQRHLKVLGIFCRLWYRDGKPGYLADLPRVFAYVREVGSRHVETAALVRLLEDAVGACELARPRAP